MGLEVYKDSTPEAEGESQTPDHFKIQTESLFQTHTHIND